MKEMDEARGKLKKLIWDYGKAMQTETEQYPEFIVIDRILNLKGNGWAIAIVKNQGLISSFVVNKEEPKFYQEVIYQAGDE